MSNSEKQPAAENPWYVLATLAGKQTEFYDHDLAQKNRNYWNAWASQGMTEEEKAAIKSAGGFSILEDTPEWASVEARVEELFKKRLSNAVLPDPSKTVDYYNVEFSNDVDFRRFFFPASTFFHSAVFSGSANFGSAVFSGDTDFDSAAFSGDANFDSAVFSGDTDFDSAVFSGPAIFGSAAFSGDANFDSAAFSEFANFDSAAFSGSTSFDSAAFSGDAIFRNAVFSGSANFNSAAFSGDTDFDSAAFSEFADFGGASFSESAYFDSTTFSGSAYFDSAEFSGPAIFRNAVFSGSANFDSAEFSGPASFLSTAFSGPSKFVKTTFQKEASFIDAVFDAPCNLRDAKFKTAYPDLEGTLLHSKTNVTAEDEHWPPAKIEQSDKQALHSCAHLRQNMASQGLNEAAHFFFRREMRHKAKLSKIWERPFYAIYRLGEYGYGVWQPLVGILTLWLVGALSLICWGSLHWATAFGLSFANIFKFFGFQRVYFEGDVIEKLDCFLKIMTGAQTVAGYFLLFLLGLGLRNRFRLK